MTTLAGGRVIGGAGSRRRDKADDVRRAVRPSSFRNAFGLQTEIDDVNERETGVIEAQRFAFLVEGEVNMIASPRRIVVRHKFHPAARSDETEAAQFANWSCPSWKDCR